MPQIDPTRIASTIKPQRDPNPYMKHSPFSLIEMTGQTTQIGTGMSCNLFLISNVLLNSIFEQKVYQSDEKVKFTEMLKDIMREMSGESGRKVVSVQILPRRTFLPALPTLASSQRFRNRSGDPRAKQKSSLFLRVSHCL